MNTEKNSSNEPSDRMATLDELGRTDEERLDTVADRNASLEERLPDSAETAATAGTGTGTGTPPAEHDEHDEHAENDEHAEDAEHAENDEHAERDGTR